MIGIFDGDYASLTFSHKEPDQGKAYDEVIQRAMITNTRIMREMPRLLRDAGLKVVTSCAYVLAETGTADFWASALESLRRLVPASGAMTAEEANRWVDDRSRESEEGIFFWASNYYAYVAVRP